MNEYRNDVLDVVGIIRPASSSKFKTKFELPFIVSIENVVT